MSCLVVVPWTNLSSRTFTQSAIARNAAGLPTSLTAFTEEELMLKDAGMYLKWKQVSMCWLNSAHYYIVSRFAQEVVKPKVSQMDETEKLDATVLKGLFDQGVSKCMDNPRSRHWSKSYSLWVLKLMLNMMVPTALSPLLSSPLKVSRKKTINAPILETNNLWFIELAKVDPSISVICDVQVCWYDWYLLIGAHY